MSNKFKQNLFAAAAVTLWGSAIPVTKMIGASVSPFGMSAVKCLVAAVLLGAAALVRKARRPYDGAYRQQAIEPWPRAKVL